MYFCHPPPPSPPSLSYSPAAITTTKAWGGTCEIVTLRNGDLRRRDELADRGRRLQILRKYGLAPGEDKINRSGGGGRRGNGEGGDYEDDGFEGEVCFTDDCTGENKTLPTL